MKVILGGLGMRSRRRRSPHFVETLEQRTLLATLVGATKVTYQDTDGDDVTVTFNKSILTPSNVNAIFSFDVGTVNGSNATKQQLRSINLTGVAGAAGSAITTNAVRSASRGGDGFAALGQIMGSGLDLGAVTIDGDLGRIIAGDATLTTSGLASLTTHSIGRFGTTTGAGDLHSEIQGKLGSLKTKSDVKQAYIDVQGGLNGRIGTVTIGGSLIGGSVNYSGNIRSTSDMGAVAISGDVVGGSGDYSGFIWPSGGILTSVAIGGSLHGGGGLASGSIASQQDCGVVKIAGNIVGGTGGRSGSITSSGKLSNVAIGGDLRGGSGQGSGGVSSTSVMGTVSILGDVRGSSGQSSGSISAGSKLAGISIGGSLLGGSGLKSGAISSSLDLGAVKIAGDVMGGSNSFTGSITSNGGKLVSVAIGGSMQGAAGISSGSISSFSDMGPVSILESVWGSEGMRSGSIEAGGKLTSATIGGSVHGGVGNYTGLIHAKSDMGTIKITGSIIGGLGTNSGGISSDGKTTSVVVGGSMLGGQSSFLSGFVNVTGELGSLTITRDLVGGSATSAQNLTRSGVVYASRIGALTIGGSVIAGTDATSGGFVDSGAIRVRDDLGIATIKGSLIGNVTNAVAISARGQASPSVTKDLAIGTLSVTGRVEYGQILAGYTSGTTPQNADAQIGPVTVGGDWIASNLIAGANMGWDSVYGNDNDAKISGIGVKDVSSLFSKITSVVISGQAFGTFGGTDFFGIVAESVGSLKVGDTTLPLLAGNSNDNLLLGLFGDFRLNEI